MTAVRLFDLDANGDITVPTNPQVAKLRLAELESDPAYVSTLLDIRHPLHAARMEERRGLLAIASRGPKS